MGDKSLTYQKMEDIVSGIPINSDGLQIYPFGNGAERMLGNKDLGSLVNQLNFNRHQRGHFYRAGLEGIAYSFAYGIEILKSLGLEIDVIRVGDDNLFQSQVFANTLAYTLDCRIEVLEATGAVGAAQASGVGVGIFGDVSEAVTQLGPKMVYGNGKPNRAYKEGYGSWKAGLEKLIK